MDPLAFISKLLGTPWRFGAAIAERAVRAKSKNNALKNMQSLTRDFAEVLRFLKSNNAKGFVAPNDNAVLSEMQRAGLLIQDDPIWTLNAQTTYYLVPDYIWNEIDNVLKDFPPPVEPAMAPTPLGVMQHERVRRYLDAPGRREAALRRRIPPAH